jgi:hypothetical protein
MFAAHNPPVFAAIPVTLALPGAKGGALDPIYIPDQDGIM